MHEYSLVGITVRLSREKGGFKVHVSIPVEKCDVKRGFLTVEE